MKKIDVELEVRERQMLDLLAKGASSQEIADDLGYREGTMRVYLHNLYRKIGVSNKTRAVIWYLGRAAPAARPDAAPRAPESGPPAGESFGDMAIRTDLLASLGAMRIFLGAHGRVWEVASRLKGNAAGPEVEARRRQSRLLWEALFRGDFGHGKRLHDDDRAAALVADSPTDGVLLAVLLTLGGYTAAADRLIALLGRRRRGRHGVSEREYALVQLVRDALAPGADAALARLQRQAAENASAPVLKHLAMAALYYAHLGRKDRERARATANAIFAEAENVRAQLQAMGERSLLGEARVPEPARPARDRAGTPREKLARVG